MAQQRIVVDAILSADNMTGTIGDIDDDPDSPDANWVTADSTADSTFHGSFSAVNAGNTLDGTQEFRVQIRRNAAAGGNDPDIAVWLYEAGSAVSTIYTTANLSDATAVIAGTWETASLTDQTGADVEIWIDIGRSGGTPSGRRVIDIGAIEWNASTIALPSGSDLVAPIIQNYRNMN